MTAHLLPLSPRQQEKVSAALAAVPRKARTTPLRKWHKLLGLLQSITLAVAGLRGMSTRVKHDLKRAAGRHVKLTVDVYDELNAWRKLVSSLAIRPTHFHELETFSPTWIGTTDVSGSGMGRVCQYPEGQYFV